MASKANVTKAKRFSEEKKKDDAVVKIICGLSYLISMANSMELGSAARILSSAKEDVAFWAVKMNFHETIEEKFLNQALYGAGVLAARDFLTGFCQANPEARKEILNAFDLKFDDMPLLKNT